MDNHTTNHAEYTDGDIFAAFENWLNDQGYQIDKDGWKDISNGKKGRAYMPGRDKEHQAGPVQVKVYTDKPAQGWYTDFKGDHVNWSFYEDYLQGRDPAQATAYKATMPSKEEQDKKRAERIAKEQAETAAAIATARQFYADHNFTPPADHGYLKRKRVTAAPGIKWTGSGENALIVPIYKLPDLKHVISLQRIYTSGFKHFEDDTHPNDGGIFFIGDPAAQDRPFALCEGYATGATVRDLTGYTVAICFNSGNLPKAAADLHKFFPGREYYIFADNDLLTARKDKKLGNPGLIGAHKAADALGIDEARIITLSDSVAEIPGCTDWNDYATSDAGADSAHRAIDEQITRAQMSKEDRFYYDALNKLQAPTLEVMQARAQERGKGLDIGFNMYNSRGNGSTVRFQGLTLIAARTGGGKTTMLSNFAARILATDPGYRLLFITLEEPADDIYTRITGSLMGGTYQTEKGPRPLILRDNGTGLPTDWGLADAIRGGELWRDEYKNVSGKISAQAWKDRSSLWGGLIEAATKIEQRVKIVDSLDVPNIAQSDVARGYINEFIRRNGEKTAIFIDYLQKMKPAGQTSGDWKDVKRILADLQPMIAKGRPIFAGVQMNRTAATDAKGQKQLTTKEQNALEFYGTYAEQIREAADLEQAADMILYSKIDHDLYPAAVNLRLLKYRRGNPDGACSIRSELSTGALQWDTLNLPTYRDTAHDYGGAAVDPAATIAEDPGDQGQAGQTEKNEYKRLKKAVTASKKAGK